MTGSIDSVPVKNSEKIVDSDFDGDLVLMNIDIGVFYTLRETARAVWDLIDGERNIAAIVATLRSRYDVAADDCQRQVEALLQDLAMANLITNR